MLDTRFSASRTDPDCALKLEQEQEQEQLLVVKLSDDTSPQVQIEPLVGICELMAIASRHMPKWSVKRLKKFMSKSLGEHPGSLLTTFNQDLHYTSILLSLWPPSKIWSLLILFPLQSFPRFGSSRITTTLFPFFVLPTSISLLCREEMPLSVPCVYADQET